METKSCKLCGKNETVKSHIIPKFVFRWLKKTGTGRLRPVANINEPTEDGIVENMLCKECEGKLGLSERYFANQVFYPVVNKEAVSFQYDQRLRYFVLSLFWRTLKDSLYKDVEGTKWANVLSSLEGEWVNYLLNDQALVSQLEIHCLIGIDVMREKERDTVMYMARMVDAGIPNNDEVCLFFVKIPRFVFILPISGFDRKSFINSKIEDSGTFAINSVSIQESTISHYLYQRAKTFAEKNTEKSDKQRESSLKLTIQKQSQWKASDLGLIDEYLKKQ